MAEQQEQSSSSTGQQQLSSFQALHRTALALNNESVSLMQQGAFSKAQTRSSQSLRVLEEMLTALPQAGDESSSASSEEESASCEEVSTKDESRTAKSLLAAIEIHVVEEGDFCELRSAVQYGGSSTVFFPVVLRDTASHNDNAKSLHELVSRQYAAALLNRAILLRLLQQQREADSQPKLSPKLLQKMKQKGVTLPAEAQVDDDSSNNKPPKLLRLAKRLLNRASAILCAVAAETTSFKDHDLNDEDDDDISCNTKNRIELMLVSALVLNCLAVVLKDCRLSKKAKIATQASQSLQALLERDAAANDGTVDDELPVAADDKTAASWRYANATTSVFAPVFISPAA